MTTAPKREDRTMPTATTTLDFLATWVDCYGNTYEQPISLSADQSERNELSAHLAWVLDHHAIASYRVEVTN